MASEKTTPVKQNSMRGYKVTEDGKKTTYFHRDISEEAKRLIGDCKPQKIETTPASPRSDALPSSNPIAPRLKSAWNDCTFESKGYNKWVDAKVTEIFPHASVIEIKTGKGDASKVYTCVSSYKSYEGDLEIISLLKGPRVVNSMSFTLEWKLYEGNVPAPVSSDEEEDKPKKEEKEKLLGEGTYVYDNDGNADYEVECQTLSLKPTCPKDVFNTYIKKDLCLVQKANMEKIKGMMQEFKKEVGLL